MTPGAAGTPGDEAPFHVAVFHNRYLAEGSGHVDAIVSVRAAGEPRRAPDAVDRAEVIVIDRSGSMYGRRKMKAAKDAAAAAVDCLEDGCRFAVVAGDHRAHTVYPRGPTLATAAPADREHAKQAIKHLEADGGTAIGEWLDTARTLFASTTAVSRHAILLTDGINEGQHPGQLEAAIQRAVGVFQCDCRGVGTDWEVRELRKVADALQGSVEFIADPDDLAADFRRTMRHSLAMVWPDMRLRAWAPLGGRVEMFRQVLPEVIDLTDQAVPQDARHTEFRLGGWQHGEDREYHLRLDVTPQPPGSHALAGQAKLVHPTGEIVGAEKVVVEWTSDQRLSTRINRQVAHYTGQAELADTIDLGLTALKAGDRRAATVKLQRAVELAEESGHTEARDLLLRVVEHDPTTGTVRLRSDTTDDDIFTTDARSRRTIRVRRAAPDPSGGGRVGDPEGGPP